MTVAGEFCITQIKGASAAKGEWKEMGEREGERAILITFDEEAIREGGLLVVEFRERREKNG